MTQILKVFQFIRKLLNRIRDNRQVTSFFSKLSFILSFLLILIFIYDFGFDHDKAGDTYISRLYMGAALVFTLFAIIRYVLFPPVNQRLRIWILDFFLILLLLMIFLGVPYVNYIDHPVILYVVFFIVFIKELSVTGITLYKRQLNPALLFVISFLLLIILGTFLLMLPNAAHQDISFVDALFTSTSAVCVTGLIVVDTGSFFTPMGQIIIMVLIQLGGLGVMTFTSFFSYFFKGSSSFEDQLILRDLTNSEKIAEVFSTLKKIILVTLTIEGIGALAIYLSVADTNFSWALDKIFFSVFHSVSAFCNAGFSTLGNSLFQTEFRYNYSFHLIVAFLFIIGGLGFPIAFNLLKYIKYLFKARILNIGSPVHQPWVLNINSKIVLFTTFVLIVSGTLLFYAFEYNNTLKEHDGWGKVVTAFFGAVTPRTAGFNSVDTGALAFNTIMIVFLLMWIGASPGSTGGGIKTTTFAVGTLNFFSLARGKDRIEIFKRKISDLSVRRAFAVISLSLVAIGFSVFLISSFDSEKKLLDIAFECFSAYGTVGLSLGITSALTTPSKLVIIGTMFVGRVGMLTILVAIFRKVKSLRYEYPTENILIN